ncbi:hypothetical protein SAMN04489740_2507 [Arthrobacter alpinus]|uniref:Uncharacterized protein n=1 Tax=Arthrobacter alpinus TaxID=656366 RepID=A0A1H5LMN8_9MICC|nr:hypothetical protein SAMN04489740_2507 [Arthrobacter alpinus]
MCKEVRSCRDAYPWTGRRVISVGGGWQDVYARSLIIGCNKNTAREFLVSPKPDAFAIRNDDPVLIEDVWRIVGDSPG